MAIAPVADRASRSRGMRGNRRAAVPLACQGGLAAYGQKSLGRHGRARSAFLRFAASSLSSRHQIPLAATKMKGRRHRLECSPAQVRWATNPLHTRSTTRGRVCRPAHLPAHTPSPWLAALHRATHPPRVRPKCCDAVALARLLNAYCRQFGGQAPRRHNTLASARGRRAIAAPTRQTT